MFGIIEFIDVQDDVSYFKHNDNLKGYEKNKELKAAWFQVVFFLHLHLD